MATDQIAPTVESDSQSIDEGCQQPSSSDDRNFEAATIEAPATAAQRKKQKIRDVSVAYAREHFAELIDSARFGTIVRLTHYGKPRAFIISDQEYQRVEQLFESLQLVQDN